jgi:HK97 family phage major capsid protein
MPEIKNEEILKKLTDVGDAVAHIQEKNDALEKKYDAVDVDSLKKASDAAVKNLEAIQEIKQQIAAMDHKERLDQIELLIAKSSDNSISDADKKEFKQAITKYFRRGIPLSDEMVEKVCDMQANMEFIGAEDHQTDSYKKDLVVGSGPDGGYWVLPDRSSDVSTRIFETSPIRQVANIVTTSSDMWEIPLDDDEFSSGWVGEVETRSDTNTSEIGLVKIPVHEGYAQPRATQKMLDDAGFDIESWLIGKVTRKLGRQENTAFVTGDGSKKPKGYLDYAAWASAGVYERNKVEQITATGTAGALDEADDLITLQNSLLEDYQGTAIFGMRRATFTSVMQLKDSQGQYLLEPSIIKGGTDKILLGKPVIFMSDMPAVAANALAVVYAAFDEFYTIVDRLGMRVLRDPYTAKPYVRFYTIKRVGGAVTNFQAGKILKINA